MDLQNLQSRHKIGACVIGRRELVEFARDIKFSHTIFSLPFVVVGLIIANVEFPTVRNAFIILLCMVSARSFAMGMNRFLDAGLDGQNLRTAVRAIPQGRLSKNTSIYINLCFALTFIGGSFLLSPLAGVLSLPLLVILGLYSMMKRWTIFTHFYLGLCLGLAPIAAELALAGRVGHLNILLGLSILFWVAGFDILYSTQDIDIDRKFKLYSFPSRIGIKPSMLVCGFCFSVMLLLLLLIGIFSGSGNFYFFGLFLVMLLLLYESWLVRDMWNAGFSKNINWAFFNTNALVSVIFMIFVVIDRLW